MPNENVELATVGWREWVRLPDLGIRNIKAKVDTGARSSALHVSSLEAFEHDGEPWVRFGVQPIPRNMRDVTSVAAPVMEYRSVRSSNGTTETRPVIVTDVELLEVVWPVELTLTNRDAMRFRMLLGREAVRGRFLVDSGRSFYGGRPKRRKRK